MKTSSTVWTIVSIVILALLFALTLRAPVEPAEAAAALAALETCYTGDANTAHQLGEPEPRRLPLHGWILSATALGRAGHVSVGAARIVSFLAILAAAAAGAAAFGSARRMTMLLIVLTPTIWAAGVRGTPGALLAACITLAWAAYETGRRLGVPTLRWTLPLILGAVASLAWSPAVFLVGSGVALEALRSARSRDVAWGHLAIGVIGAVASVGLWRMAYAGFNGGAGSWLAVVLADLRHGDPVLAARGVAERWLPIAWLWFPAVVLFAAGFSRRAGRKVRTGPGILVAAALGTLLALFNPGVPVAVAVPAAIIALGELGSVVRASARVRKTETVLAAFLFLFVAMVVLHTPHAREPFDSAPYAKIAAQDHVVVDREIGIRETWKIVDRLGRPAKRSAPTDAVAWYVGFAERGPGLAVERAVDVEGWSLMARPLVRPALSGETSALFERNLAEATAEYEANPRDALNAIWVGRRIAYLGRHREAIAWYTDAMFEHPAESRLFRHRGHRFISVRLFDRAIEDLERAAALEEGREDRVEPDGLPNAAGIPTSTTQTNIWYHLGLAYYLKGDLEQTVRCYREYLERSENDDSVVAGTHWLHIALRRLGRDAEAAQLLDRIPDEMTIIENDSYHDLVMLYAGRLNAQELQDRLDRGDGPSQAALAYGLARWYEDSGDEARAREAYFRLVSEAPWAAFGTIAAEAELAARFERARPVW